MKLFAVLLLTCLALVAAKKAKFTSCASKALTKCLPKACGAKKNVKKGLKKCDKLEPRKTQTCVGKAAKKCRKKKGNAKKWLCKYMGNSGLDEIVDRDTCGALLTKCKTGGFLPQGFCSLSTETTAPAPAPANNDPPCGNGIVGSGLCEDPSLCCSEWGWCGDTTEHCDPATCWSGPSCSRRGAPCGDGTVGTGLCEDYSLCCSEWGWCDNTEEHCDASTCWSGPGCPRDGRPCGDGIVGTGLCSSLSDCCSQYGYCGDTTEHCDPFTCYSSPDNSCARVAAVNRGNPSPTIAPSQPAPSPSTSPPSAQPNSLPTIDPSQPTPAPSSLPPSSQPSAVVDRFKGIDNAYSIKKGVIEINWDGSFLDSDTFFDVFVALGDYDFNTMLASNSVEDLISLFEDEPSFQHHEVNGANKMSINTTNYGELHTLLVTAQIDGGYSSNTASKAVVVSSSEPHIRDEVNVVGIFVPTSLVQIELADAPEGIEHTLTFTGPVAPQALNMLIGDYITGFTSDLKPFIRRVVGITQNTPSSVALNVLHAKFEEIFDELDIDGGFALSRNRNDAPGRRLGFLDDVVGFVGDVGNAIGDAVTTVIEDVGEFFVETFGGEKLEEFKLIDIHVKWEHEILGAGGKVSNVTVESKLNVLGEVDFEVSLFAKFRVAGVVPVFAHVGAKAEYYFESALEASAGVGREYSKTYDIWTGKRMSRVIIVGPVPIEVYSQPKLELQVKAKASISVSSKVGITMRGDTEAGVVYDAGHSPALYDKFKPPSFHFDPIFPTFEGKAVLEASTALVLSLDAGVYGGLLAANVGLSAGLGMAAEAGVHEIIGETILPTINRFDLDIIFSIPFSASALYGEFDIFETTIYKKTWPILTLPSATLEIQKDHRCVLGGDNNGAVASLSLKADQEYPRDALIGNGFTGSSTWYLTDSSDGWFTSEMTAVEIVLEKTGLTTSSPEPEGTVTFVTQPRFPPLPLKIVSSVSLQSLFSEEVQCTEAGPCDGDAFFDKLTQQVSAEFNSQIFLSQPPDPNAPPVPSNVYKFEDFMTALKKLQNADENFQFWLGDDCSVESQKAALVNMAAFLGQSMRETIIYDACDENNWDKWRADIFKEPTSPPENLPALYPMSSGCGQLGQKYADYRCDDECPLDLNMELTATTNAAWIGAPPPLVCGPKSKYDGLGYWNPQKFCDGPDRTCVGKPFYYPGQTAGVHVPVSEDNRFPEYFYTNPLPDANGNTPEPRSPDKFPATNVEGCCWWGRGVIQTTGRCNFGKLNKNLGAGAGSSALYPEIDFCQNPQAICDGPSDLKWVAGIFFWVSDPQKYDRDGFNYKDGVKEFVSMGCADNPDGPGCDFLFEYASGIVNRGCHDPGETGCPGCVPGATCDPAHNVPERVQASKQALRSLMATLL